MHLKLVPGGKACDLPYILIYFFFALLFSVQSIHLCDYQSGNLGGWLYSGFFIPDVKWTKSS